MEGGSFSKCGPRLSAAHIRRASRIEGGSFPRTFVQQQFARFSRVKGGYFLCGSRINHAHIRSKVPRVARISMISVPKWRFGRIQDYE
eukprot:3141330-Pyramimonas_sp.AAC.1